MKALVVISVGMLLMAACSDRKADPGTPTATETATSAPGTATPAPVPGLFIVAPDGTGASGAAGTRCWAHVCIDYIGPVTPAEPVNFPAAATLQWQAEGGTVTEFVHAWIPAAGAESRVDSDGFRAWNLAPGEMVGEPVVVPSEPGEYVLVVFTRYSDGSDVSFGFYITVE